MGEKTRNLFYIFDIEAERRRRGLSDTLFQPDPEGHSLNHLQGASSGWGALLCPRAIIDESFEFTEKGRNMSVDCSPFVAARVATIQLRLPRTLLPRGQLDIRGPALGTDSMVDVHFQRVNDVAGL